MSYNYLTQSQIARLKEHKYSSTGRSLLEAIFQPFWNWVVTLMPLWVAPNLITIVGLIINIITSAAVVGYSPLANSHDVPPHIFILCAAGLFIYQTLDAIDGKQARRTGTSSPLGELFDHGCDAVSTVCVTMSVACALSLGTHPNYLFYFYIHTTGLFYLAHWQTYCYGSLVFNKFDVTETQVGAMVISLVAGFIGPQFFLTEIKLLPYNLNIAKAFIYCSALGGIVYAYIAMQRILHGGVGKNGTTVAYTSVLSPTVPIGILYACAFYVFKHSSEDLFYKQPSLFMLAFGACTAKLTCNLIVASMSKSPLEMVDACMLGPCMLVFKIYFDVDGVMSMFGMNLPENTELYMLYLIVFFNLVQFVRYSSGICGEISRDFNINVFSIPYSPEKKAE